MSRLRSFTAALLLALLAGSAHAQNAQPVALTLDEALQIALERNYAIRTSALNVETANSQIREAWGQLFPRVDLTSSYTRNVVSANPFAGSDAGGLFGSLGFLDWLAFNEEARTDEDAETEPLSLDEFRRRQAEGQANAGITANASDNPFSVPNQVVNQVSVSQTLYSGSAFAAVRGAQSLREINEAALDLQEDQVIHQTRQLFYGALLAQQQVNVITASVERTRATYEEANLLVAQGVQPKLTRLQAEVQLANTETQLIQARTAAEAARDQFLFLLGLPVDRPIQLRGELDVPDSDTYRSVGLIDAIGVALDERPDVEQARLAVELQQVQRSITRAAYFPEVSAFANLSLNASLPDNRTVVTQTGPFDFESSTNSFFSGDYWQPSVAVGVRLNWNLFDGFQTTRRVQQNTIAIQQAEIQLEQAQEAVKLEVAQALRELESARQRVNAQERTVTVAQTAYDFAFERLRTGVGAQLDVRQASDNLDQSSLLYLQAIHDYLVARSNVE
ncbi:MAG: TolC family protein, partial [Rhodothermaceae bacterium]|nr:TolC family protein [Rhodothermaceae bacterium]